MPSGWSSLLERGEVAAVHVEAVVGKRHHVVVRPVLEVLDERLDVVAVGHEGERLHGVVQPVDGDRALVGQHGEPLPQRAQHARVVLLELFLDDRERVEHAPELALVVAAFDRLLHVGTQVLEADAVLLGLRPALLRGQIHRHQRRVAFGEEAGLELFQQGDVCAGTLERGVVRLGVLDDCVHGCNLRPGSRRAAQARRPRARVPHRVRFRPTLAHRARLTRPWRRLLPNGGRPDSIADCVSAILPPTQKLDQLFAGAYLQLPVDVLHMAACGVVRDVQHFRDIARRMPDGQASLRAPRSREASGGGLR